MTRSAKRREMIVLVRDLVYGSGHWVTRGPLAARVVGSGDHSRTLGAESEPGRSSSGFR